MEGNGEGMYTASLDSAKLRLQRGELLGRQCFWVGRFNVIA